MSSQSNNAAKQAQHLAAANELESKGQLEDALAECELALAAVTASADAHNLHGILLDRLGRPVEAISAFTRAVQLAPDNEDARANLSEVQHDLETSRRRGRYQRAWPVALAGALTFAVIVGMVEWYASLIAPQHFAGLAQDTLLIDLWSTFLRTAAYGIGMMVLALASHNATRAGWFFIAGAVSSIVGGWVASFSLNLGLPLVTPDSSWLVYLVSIISRALFGAVLGVGLGVVLPGRSFLKAMIAGALGGGIGVLITSGASSIFISLLTTSALSPNDPRSLALLSAAFQATVALLTGAGLGWVVGLSMQAQEKAQPEVEQATA